MHLTALLLAALACVAIIVIGIRFLLVPERATADYGVRPDDLRALTAVKGVRDVVSGVGLLVVWAAAGPVALGWAVLAAALTPVADAVVVMRRGGRPATALGVHGSTAALLAVVGLVLAQG